MRAGADSAPVLRARKPPEKQGSRVIVSVDFIRVADGQPRARSDLSAYDYVSYLTGEDRPAGENKGRDGGVPILFTSAELMPPPDGFLEKWKTSAARVQGISCRQAWCVSLLSAPLPGERTVFSMKVSFHSAEGRVVSLEKFAREFMTRVQNDHFGVPFTWAGAAHFNTDNPHLHLFMRGVARDGRIVRLHPEYVNKGFRWRAIALLEEMLAAKTARKTA